VRRRTNDDARLPITLRPDLELLPLDGDWVLFSEQAQCLVRLNESAAFVVRELQSGTPADDLAPALIAAGLAQRGEAERWAADTLEGLRSQGMLEGAPVPQLRRAGSLEEGHRRAQGAMPRFAPFVAKTEQRYCLLETCALVRFAFLSQKRLVDAAIGHLAFDEPCTPTVVIDIQGVQEGLNTASNVYRDGNPIGHAPQLTHLGPIVKAALWECAVSAYNFLLYIHAGVVATREGCVLLPAAPGGGKSSLTAALIHRGFRYFSDEVALVEPVTFRVPPVPLAICVKSTGWELMARYYPDIENLPPHRRSDGKLVRYIAPPTEAARCASLPVSHIIFPYFEANSATELVRVPRAEALGRLMEECLALSRRLSRENVAEMVRWVAAIDCYALTFQSLDEAAELIGQLALNAPG
jgi:hypothetical protein